MSEPTVPASTPALQFGLQLSRFTFDGSTGPSIAELARTAEAIGFTSFRVMDHPTQIPQVGRHWDDILEPFTTLAFVAASTSTLRVGPLVCGVTHRNIAMLGKAVASLDVLSGGRAECGLGLAWYERDHTAYGLAFPSIAERYELLEDALEFLPLLWGKGAPAYKGRRFSSAEALCYPRPIQGRVPILLGGQGERRTLRLAARHADAVNLFGSPSLVGSKIAVLRHWCEVEERDPGAVRITHFGETVVAPSPAAVESGVLRHGPRSGRAAWAARVGAGTPADQIRRFTELADAGVTEAFVSFPDPAMVEAFAPVVQAFR